MFAVPALDEPRILTIPVIRVAFALSVVLHAVMLWAWFPRLHEMSFERSERDKASGPLVVELAPEPTRAASVAPEPPPAPVVETPRPKPAAAPKARAASAAHAAGHGATSAGTCRRTSA